MLVKKIRIAFVLALFAVTAAVAQNWQKAEAGNDTLVSQLTSGTSVFVFWGSDKGNDEIVPLPANIAESPNVADDANETSLTAGAPCVPNQKTWDGEGTTNNWSEAANWTCDLVPINTDDVFFDGTSTKDATINISVTAQVFRMNAGYTGTIAQGPSNLTVIGGITQSAGTFDGGSGTITSSPGALTLNGGVFNAGSSTIKTGGSVTVTAASTFNADSGTVTFEVGGGGGPVSVNSTANPGALLFNNIQINRGGFPLQVQSGTLIALGAVELATGGIQGGTVEARGNVTVAPTFTQGSSSTNGILEITGAAARTVTIPGGAVMPGLTLNAPNTLVNTSGAGTIRFKELVSLLDGTIDQGSVDFSLFTNTDSSLLQTGGIFNGGSGAFAGGIMITGGAFNGGSGVIDCNIAFSVTGGTFNGGSSTLQISAAFTVASTATFIPGTGKIIFDGSGSTVTLNPTASPNSLTVNNVEINRGGFALQLQATQKLIVAGTLELTSGGIVNGTVEALGNVTVGSVFTAGSNGRLRFAGNANQTFTNPGNTSLSGLVDLTIDKGIGSTVTANGGLVLSIGTFQGDLNITSGTLRLNNNSILTSGSINVAANGKLVNESSTTILLKGSVVNDGVIDLQGGGAACPESDSILIRSVGGQVAWTGGGRYRLVDVDVQNMGGSGTKNVFSGTNTGGNNASWVFDPGCPTALSITPSTANVQTGQTQQFTAGGGFSPYTFNILTNNSGGTINASGLYTAGTTAGVTDTVRVTDSFGNTADAAISTFGVANRLAFTTQPTNTVAGQTINSAQVTVQDAFGNAVTNSIAPITLSIANNPNGGTLVGTLTRNAVNGVATFDNLSINRAGTGYTLQAASGSLISATSNTFNISVGAASQLAFTVQPGNTNAGFAITPAVQVAIVDQAGNIVPTATDTISVAIGSNPSSGTLSGTLSRNALNGVSIFNNLSLNNPGNGYTLEASSGTLTSAASTSFNIISPFVVTNTNNSGPGSLRQAILNSNSTAGIQTISFNIPGPGPYKITPIASLPLILDSTILDATTQPGFAGTPIVEISGENAQPGSTAGLEARNGDTTIRGFVINRWVFGIRSGGNSTIRGNYIGTDVAGLTALPNQIGITIVTGDSIIGGFNTGDGNLISGNSDRGITFLPQTPVPNLNIVSVIAGNLLGTKADGISPLGNNTAITFSDEPGAGEASCTIIDNVIAHNLGRGIEVSAVKQRTFLSVNSIHSNGALGFDNRFFGVTTNDPLDADIGPNELLNFPELTSVVSQGGSTTIQGRINSKPSTAFTMFFYVNDSCDPSGYGEGQNHILTATRTTDSSGIANFAFNISQPLGIGKFVTATLSTTDSNRASSEFSQCQIVAGSSNSISGRITDSADAPMSGVLVNLQGTTNSILTQSDGTYTFDNLPGGFNYTIVPSLPSATFAPTNRTITNLASNQINEDFVGTSSARVTGQAMSAVGGISYPLVNTTVNLSGAGNGTTQTDANGRFVFNQVANGNYTVSANKPGFVFAPSSFAINVNGDQNVNFSAQVFDADNMSGRVLRGGIGLPMMNADGSGSLTLYPYTGIDTPSQGSFSGDGSKIVYKRGIRSDNTNVVGRIHSANFDGSNETDVSTPTDIRISEDQPRFSPDASKIVFVRTGDGSLSRRGSFLCIRNADGSGLQTIHSVPNGNSSYGIRNPSYSPDGTMIVFAKTSFLPTFRQIYVINTDGSNLRQLTTGFTDELPLWSPDSSKIMFRRSVNFLDHRGAVFTMNPDGTNQVEIQTTQPATVNFMAWSPDGTKILFDADNIGFNVMNSNGSGLTPLNLGGISSGLSWVPNFSPPVAAGANVTINIGSSTVAFANVGTAGTVNVTPIPPNSVGTLPNGFVVGNMAYQISTTAVVTPPIEVCINLPSTTAQSALNMLHIFHAEGGIQVDRTSSRVFADTPVVIRRICATTSSLSPFVLAQQIDNNLPSISGIAIDSNGNPMSGVSMSLTGTDSKTTETDSDGVFRFVNLTPNGNYNVSPKQVGYLFDEYNTNFVNVTGEETVVFEGTQRNFQISGQVADGNGVGINSATVELDGSAQASAQTDANGNYTFINLPADGFYTVTPFNGINPFTPNAALVDPLTSDAADVNFQMLAPTAANSSIGGRILTANGQGIRNVIIQMTSGTGETQYAYSSSFGYYKFNDLPVGETYILSVQAKKYTFANPTRVITLNEDLTDEDFVSDGK